MKFFLSSVLCFISCAVFAQSYFSVKNSVVVNNGNCYINKLEILMPVPQSNNYQTISNLSISSGEILQTSDGYNSYLRDIRISNLPAFGESYSLSQSYNITLFPLHIDFSQFKTIYEYDKQSNLYKAYTKSDGTYIDTNNTTIQSISNDLWKKSNGNIIDYARMCYEYIAANFKYQNPYTGIHPIAEIIRDNGGDCGNLASIFVNLLRCKGIPSRHVVTIRPNGSYHVWNDFYLEKYGWIPLDVNAKLDHPQDDFFGFCAGDGIVVSTDVCNNIEIEEGQIMQAVILQTFFWWYRYSGGNTITSALKTQGTLLPSAVKTTIKSLSNKSAAISFDGLKNISYYKLNLYKNNDTKTIGTFTSDNFKEIKIDNLEAKTNYEAIITTYRKIDNIEARLNRYSVTFTTNEIPTSIGEADKSKVTLTSSGSEIFLSGLKDGETIYFYTISGALIGSTKAVGDKASFESGLNNQVIIVKIGNNSRKIKI